MASQQLAVTQQGQPLADLVESHEQDTQAQSSPQHAHPRGVANAAAPVTRPATANAAAKNKLRRFISDSPSEMPNDSMPPPRGGAHPPLREGWGRSSDATARATVRIPGLVGLGRAL